MFLRKNKKHSKNDSIDDVICFDKTGNELKIADMLSDDTDIAEDYVQSESLDSIKDLVDNLPGKDKDIIKLYFGFYGRTYNQYEIADIFHTFQSYISKKIVKIIKTLKEQLDTTKPHIKKDIIYSSPNTITKEDCQKLLNFLKTPALNQMTEILTAKEAVIVFLNFGFIDGKYFSIEVIAKFLKIDIPEVLEAIRKGSLYKDNINLLKNDALVEEPPKR